jgi:hypothetical protein
VSPVRLTTFDNSDGSYSYTHDEGGHGGSLDAATVSYGQNLDGSPDYYVVAVPCPECGSVSFWPSGGGADALMGQSLHVKMAMRPSGLERSAPLTLEEATAQVKQRVIATDGEQRWVLDDAVLRGLG